MQGERGTVSLVKVPEQDSLKWLMDLRRALALELSISQLTRQAQTLPCPLLTRCDGRQFRRLLERRPDLADYLEFQATERYDTSFGTWSQMREMAQRIKQGLSPKPPEPEPGGRDLQQFVLAAELVAGPSSLTAQNLARCAADPAAYFEQHRERYRQRNVLSADSPETLCLLALADQLTDAGLLWELDWKEEREEFFLAAWKLAQSRQADLPLELAWLEEGEDPADWVAEINRRWNIRGFALAELVMDSDSYPLLCLPLPLLDQLRRQVPGLLR